MQKEQCLVNLLKRGVTFSKKKEKRRGLSGILLAFEYENGYVEFLFKNLGFSCETPTKCCNFGWFQDRFKEGTNGTKSKVTREHENQLNTSDKGLHSLGNCHLSNGVLIASLVNIKNKWSKLLSLSTIKSLFSSQMQQKGPLWSMAKIDNTAPVKEQNMLQWNGDVLVRG